MAPSKVAEAPLGTVWGGRAQGDREAGSQVGTAVTAAEVGQPIEDLKPRFSVAPTGAQVAPPVAVVIWGGLGLPSSAVLAKPVSTLIANTWHRHR